MNPTKIKFMKIKTLNYINNHMQYVHKYTMYSSGLYDLFRIKNKNEKLF